MTDWAQIFTSFFVMHMFRYTKWEDWSNWQLPTVSSVFKGLRALRFRNQMTKLGCLHYIGSVYRESNWSIIPPITQWHPSVLGDYHIAYNVIFMTPAPPYHRWDTFKISNIFLYKHYNWIVLFKSHLWYFQRTRESTEYTVLTHIGVWVKKHN